MTVLARPNSNYPADLSTFHAIFVTMVMQHSHGEGGGNITVQGT
jgi:hypothetical protein